MTDHPDPEQEMEPHSIWLSLLLHFSPAVLILAFVFLIVPILKNLGLPLRFATILSIFLVLIPVELGILFYQGKKRNGRLSLDGIVVFREKIPGWQYFLWVPVLVTWSGFLALQYSPVGNFLATRLFFWLPDWFFGSDLGTATIPILVVMVVSYGIANISAAIVEELYFRGFLLPRLSRLKGWGPLLNTVLFAFQHFLTPWQVPFVIIGVLPQACLVYHKRNIYLGILAHGILNLLSSILLFLSIFG